MFGSVFVAALRHNDNGILNMSGLNSYLCRLWDGMQIPPSFRYLPALYGDGIFQLLSAIIPRYDLHFTIEEVDRTFKKGVIQFCHQFVSQSNISIVIMKICLVSLQNPKNLKYL